MKTAENIGDYTVENGFYFIPWHLNDVRERMDRPDLTDEQCHEVLRLCFKWHDGNTGMNWEAIDDACDQLGIERGEEE